MYVGISSATIHDSQMIKPFIRIFSKSKNLKILAADSVFDAKTYMIYAKRKTFLDAATNIRRNKNKPKYKPAHRWIVGRTFGWLS